MEVTSMKNMPRNHGKNNTNATESKAQPIKAILDKFKALLDEKSGYELRIIGVIRRLGEINDPVEALTADEIKAAVRVIFPYLSLTESALAEYFLEAKRQNGASREFAKN